MTEFSKNLQALREKLPAGAIKAIAKTQGERVRLNAMWKKETLEDMTPGEREMYNKVVEYRAKQVAEIEAQEKRLAALVK